MPPSPNDLHPPTEAPEGVLDRMVQSVRRHGMMTPGERVLVGVSGGADSTALLHLLHRLAPEWTLHLGVAHMDHMLRPDAEHDAAFVDSMAAGMDLPFHLSRHDVTAYCKMHRLSLEDGGRRLRYRFFSDLGRTHGYRKVAVGHHGNDNAEQVLMSLARGAGPTGLSGIPPIHDGWVIRPLIDLRKQDIRDYLQRHGLTCTNDPSNQDRQFLRNRIRYDVLPLLASETNPLIIEALNRTADIMREENLWIEDMVDAAREDITLSARPDRHVISATGFNRSPLPVRRRLVRHIIRDVKGDLLRISHHHIDSVVTLMNGSDGSRTIHLPDRVLATRQYEEGIISRSSAPLRGQTAIREGVDSDYRYTVNCPGSKAGASIAQAIDHPSASVVFTTVDPSELPEYRNAGHHVAFFDMEMLDFPLVLRTAQPGDRIHPLNMDGSKTVAKLLKDAKMTPDQRSTAPVLVSGDLIVWVIGKRVGHHARITSRTQKVLKAEHILPIPDS